MKLIIDIDKKDYEFIKSVRSIMKGSDTFQLIAADLFKAVQKAEVSEGATYEDKPQGEWICTFHSSFPQYESNEYRCSICNGVGGRFDKFCRHCGAAMKGNV